MSGSDKIFIKYYLNDHLLGIYSLAYTMSSVLLIVNNGFSVAISRVVYKNLNAWQKGNERIKLLFLLIIFNVILSSILVLLVIIDKKYFHILTSHDDILPLMLAILPGFWFFGIYQFYAATIFAKRRTKVILKIGLFCSLLNVFFNNLLIKNFL
jgi:O-antigen/teichoic acid export membrane protein